MNSVPLLHKQSFLFDSLTWFLLDCISSKTQLKSCSTFYAQYVDQLVNIILQLTAVISPHFQSYPHGKCYSTSHDCQQYMLILTKLDFLEGALESYLHHITLRGNVQKKKSLFKDIIQIKVDHPPSYPIFDKLFFDKF